MIVREEVFVREQNVPLELELDEFDDIADHLVIYKDQRPIAVGRLIEKENYYTLGRVAVLKEFRGKQFGYQLMKELLKKAQELGAAEIRIHAQLTAEKFCKKLGFIPYGEIFEEAGIEHISMKVTL